MLSATATVLLLLSATILKPLLGKNITLQVPTITVSSGVTGHVTPVTQTTPEVKLLLDFPHLPQGKRLHFLEMKRQFGSWGGKKRSVTSPEDGSNQKRQFSPWGGKRSPIDKLGHLVEFNASSPQPFKETTLSGEKNRNFNSWGIKRAVSNPKRIRGNLASKSKRSLLVENGKPLNDWKECLIGKGIKRLLRKVDWLNLLDDKRSFSSWGGKKSFNSWGGKRSFNSWGGKRNYYS